MCTVMLLFSDAVETSITPPVPAPAAPKVSGPLFVPGDVLHVICANDRGLVTQLLNHLGHQRDGMFALSPRDKEMGMRMAFVCVSICLGMCLCVCCTSVWSHLAFYPVQHHTRPFLCSHLFHFLCFSLPFHRSPIPNLPSSVPFVVSFPLSQASLFPFQPSLFLIVRHPTRALGVPFPSCVDIISPISHALSLLCACMNARVFGLCCVTRIYVCLSHCYFHVCGVRVVYVWVHVSSLMGVPLQAAVSRTSSLPARWRTPSSSAWTSAARPAARSSWRWPSTAGTTGRGRG